MSAPVAILAARHVDREPDVRMEELVHAASAATLEAAGLRRADVDSVILAASDERDGRSISSMLASAPAGGLLKQVTKVTDGSLHALALAVMKVQAGAADSVLVVSWDVGSEAQLDAVARTALEPFVDRHVGAIDPAATALLASAYLAETGQGPDALDRRAARKAVDAGLGDRTPGEWVSHPLRQTHLAPERDGAAAVLIASDGFVRGHGLQPIGTIEGMGWRTDTYAPAERERPVSRVLRGAADDALGRAGVTLGDIDAFEVDDRDVFAECIAAEALGLAPAGGGLALLVSGEDPFRRRTEDGFAGLPRVCAGLWRLAQAAANAPAGERSLVHQSVGRAGQGHAVGIVRWAT